MELAKLLALIVAGIWILLLLIYLIMKDIKDRKYNKLLKELYLVQKLLIDI